ncbi:hypothetical protein KIH74_04250 [Kineosporia sp. J2-2]|uniref:Uncharacterized protein n=1 Tax=Kineosporia corallincola TaxID=2835133 RepID=A0ABS5TCG9_9ACTN|nr:hypothetical protein [Kineosporia corallincola]MBT0768119.1 hypothetical protein [Kineosporia corallincola]
MPTELLDVERTLTALRERILVPGESVTDIHAGKRSLWVETSVRGLLVSRPQWQLAAEPWADDVLEVKGDEPMTHTERELFGLVHAKDGSSYALGLHRDDDLAALASRLTLPPGQAVQPVALAEMIALLGTGGHFHGALIEGSAGGDPLLERFPQAGEIESWLHPVRWQRVDGEVRLKFFSYSVYPTDEGRVVGVDAWAVTAPAAGETRIRRDRVAELAIGMDGELGEVRLLG